MPFIDSKMPQSTETQLAKLTQHVSSLKRFIPSAFAARKKVFFDSPGLGAKPTLGWLGYLDYRCRNNGKSILGFLRACRSDSYGWVGHSNL